jgi:hypothetical protein
MAASAGAPCPVGAIRPVMVRPSALNVRCTKFHWSALTTFCGIPTK